MHNALRLCESIGVGEVRFAHQAFHRIVGRHSESQVTPKLIDEFKARRPELIEQGVAVLQGIGIDLATGRAIELKAQLLQKANWIFGAKTLQVRTAIMGESFVVGHAGQIGILSKT